MSSRDVTVVIPTYNRRSLLERLLATLRDQVQAPTDIFVVDNGSTDGTAQWAASEHLRVIRMPVNTGFARAVNTGIDAARTPLIAVLNNDVELRADWLVRLIEAMTEGVWFAVGKILTPSGLIDAAGDALSRGACPWRIGHGRPDSPAFSSRRAISFAPATATLYRADLFRLAGGFDPRFDSYLEDVELSVRCARRGWPGIYVPEAVAIHQGSATLGQWHPEVVRLLSRNQVLLLACHYPSRLLLRFAWPILVGQLLWGFLAARRGAAGPWLRGKMQGLGQFASVRSASDLHTGENLGKILHASEREIRDFQRRAGFDRFWKLYFLLTSGGAD